MAHSKWFVMSSFSIQRVTTLVLLNLAEFFLISVFFSRYLFLGFRFLIAIKNGT